MNGTELFGMAITISPSRENSTYQKQNNRSQKIYNENNYRRNSDNTFNYNNNYQQQQYHDPQPQFYPQQNSEHQLNWFTFFFVKYI